MVKKAEQKVYDLWDSVEKSSPTVESEGHAYYLRTTGQLKPVFKNEYVHSILPSVEVPIAGASYNPSVDAYMNYANKIAGEEDVEIKKEERVKRMAKLKPGDSYCTTEDLRREEKMGFFDSSDEGTIKDIKTEDEIKTEDDADLQEPTKKKLPKPKTIKQRRRKMELRLEELQRKDKKRTKIQIAELDRLKSMLKDVKAGLKETEEKKVERRRKRVFRNLVETKRLGHGKFEEYKEPVLLPGEIKGSMISIKPQGNILKERMKSLQKRNMLQPKSNKKQKQLKTNLKYKVVDNREVRDFMKEERAKLNDTGEKKGKRKRRRSSKKSEITC